VVPIDCNTLAKPCQVVYEETYYARDSGTLEQLKELSTKRQALEESINGSSRITPAIAREMAGGITSPILQVIFLWSYDQFLHVLYDFKVEYECVWCCGKC
jgi:hypothetical protein